MLLLLPLIISWLMVVLWKTGTYISDLGLDLEFDEELVLHVGDVTLTWYGRSFDIFCGARRVRYRVRYILVVACVSAW